MSGLSFHGPEFVSFDEYVDFKASAIPLTSLTPNESYAVRLRRKEPTSSIFAVDLASCVLETEDCEGYSIVRFALAVNAGLTRLEAGINLAGIVFKHKPLPNVLDPISFDAERGYFMEALNGNNGQNEIAEIDEVAEAKRHQGVDGLVLKS